MNDTHFQILRLLQANPEMNQRVLASELGISLGKANYCLRALVKMGWIKARRFQKSVNKLGYLYILTPGGMEAKARVTRDFLKRRIKEYEALKREIEELSQEAGQSSPELEDPTLNLP